MVEMMGRIGLRPRLVSHDFANAPVCRCTTTRFKRVVVLLRQPDAACLLTVGLVDEAALVELGHQAGVVEVFRLVALQLAMGE